MKFWVMLTEMYRARSSCRPWPRYEAFLPPTLIWRYLLHNLNNEPLLSAAEQPNFPVNLKSEMYIRNIVVNRRVFGKCSFPLNIV
jgi:hypothetical protein